MTKDIWFDMDGTIADLYGQENWLERLESEDATPYENARPLLSMSMLARALNKKIAQGYTINIVSWLCKNSSENFDVKVTKAKRKWLKKHLPSVAFTRIDIIKYGTPKQYNRNGMLFDDEMQNRDNWKGVAFDEQDILGVLKSF